MDQYLLNVLLQSKIATVVTILMYLVTFIAVLNLILRACTYWFEYQQLCERHEQEKQVEEQNARHAIWNDYQRLSKGGR